VRRRRFRAGAFLWAEDAGRAAWMHQEAGMVAPHVGRVDRAPIYGTANSRRRVFQNERDLMGYPQKIANFLIFIEIIPNLIRTKFI